MLAITLDLSLIYLYSFLTGIGLHRMLTPGFLKRPSFALVFVPCLGLAQLTIVCAYLIFFSAPIVDSLFVSGAIGALTFVFSALRGKPMSNSISDQIRVFFTANFRSWGPNIAKIGFFVLLLGIVMSPVIRAGIPTTPYRIGIDQVGYAETAQYLLEGGTLKKIKATLLSQLNTTDIAKAKNQNLRVFRFETYVDSEFLLKAFRWGFPGAVAALTFLTGSSHAYRTAFLLVIFSYALMLALSFRILRDYFRVPTIAAFAAMVAVALNCNLLNVYYEGQLTQVFMLPLFTIMLVLLLQARSFPTAKGDFRVVPRGLLKSLFLFMLLVACTFSTYNEAMVLIIGFVVVTVILDLIFYRKFAKLPLIFAGLGLAGGFIAVFPFSKQWFVYTIANLHGLSAAGFWQPHWASFAEILGLLNMYSNPGYALVPRTLSNVIIDLTLSIFLVAVVAYFVRKIRDIDSVFWISPLAIILVAYLKMHFIDQILNYPYMKIYTMLTPLVACFAFAALYNLGESKNAVAIKNHVTKNRRQIWDNQQAAAARHFVTKYAMFLAVVTVAATGLLYINQYLGQSGYVTSDMFSMYTYADGARKFSDVALVTAHRVPSIADYMLVPLISMNLVNEGREKYIAPYLHLPVVVIMRSGNLRCRACFIRLFRKRIVYQNDLYIFLNSGKELRKICSTKADQYTLSSLDFNNKSDWPGLPQQCNLEFGLTYLSYANTGWNAPK